MYLRVVQRDATGRIEIAVAKATRNASHLLCAFSFGVGLSMQAPAYAEQQTPNPPQPQDATRPPSTAAPDQPASKVKSKSNPAAGDRGDASSSGAANSSDAEAKTTGKSALEKSGAGSKAAAKPAPPQRFDINDFAVVGADLLPQIELEEAIYPFLGPNRSADDVEKARAALEKAYRDKGFQTVSVAIPEQNVQRKVVTLKVTEMKVGRLRVKGSRYYDITKIKEQAPSLREGLVPNFDAVTKDIVSLNQLPDRRVTPALRAGVTPGTVDVDLNVEDK